MPHLYLGYVYNVGTWEEFQTNYPTPYGQLVPVTAPTPDNHEWSLRDEGYRPYWREQKGTETVPDYYAFRVAGWKILSLSSEADHRPGSPQLKWLEHKVRMSGNCRLAFLHRSRWSAGRKGNNRSLSAVWRTLRGHSRLLSRDEHNSQHIAMRDGIV